MLIRRELLLVLSHYTVFCGASNNDAAANPLVRKRGSGLLRGRSSYADADAFDFDPYLGVPRELKPDDLSMMEVNQPLLSMSYDTKFPTSAPPPPIDALATPTPTCMKTKQPAPAPIDALTSPPPTNMQQQQQQDAPALAPMDALTTPPPTSMQQQEEAPAPTPAPMDALTSPPPTFMQQQEEQPPAPTPMDSLTTPTPTCNPQHQQQQDTPAQAPIDALTTPPPTSMQQQQEEAPAFAPMDALTTPPPTSMQQQQQQQDTIAPAPIVDSLTTPPPTSIQQQQQQEATAPAPTPAPMDAFNPTPTCIPQHQQEQQDTPAQAPMDALTTPPPTYMKQQQQDTPAPAPIVDALTTPPPTSMQQQQQDTPASAPAPMDALTTPSPTCIQQPCMHHQQQQTTCSWKFYHQCAFKNDNGVLTRTSNSFVTFGVTSAQPDKYAASVSFFNRPKNDDTEYEIISTGSQVYPTNQNITESRTFTYNTNGYYELGYNVTFGEGSGYCTNKTVEYLGWIYFDDNSCSFGKM